MDKQEIKKFFDEQASHWDADMVKNDEIINIILDNAGLVKENGEEKSILDVACGTGVMIEFYKERGYQDITGIDISDKMIEKAKEKFPEVTFLCGDVEKEDFGRKFDYIVVYNAFPHFPSGVDLVERLTGLLKDGGVLTIAHGMSRKQIDNHHRGKAARVSNGLISSGVLAKIFKYFKLDVQCDVSNDFMYQVAGRKTNA
ncbi:MAG: class I SAM-dependent methyltransferase [Lachnospiraceae bacterium]|nr:class I SAM-dependent methyltransferase [Lachnospiraceae bacterium]